MSSQQKKQIRMKEKGSLSLGGRGGGDGAVKKEVVGGFSTELSFLALL